MMEYENELTLTKTVDQGIPERRCYTVEDLQEILNCGRVAVYELLKKNEFRYFKLGRRGYRISRKSFDEWLDKATS